MAVELNVTSQLGKIIEDLQKIAEQSQKVGDGLKDTGKNTSDELDKQTKRTQDFLTNLRQMGARVADGLKQDFKALMSINALSQSLKLSEQFRGSVKEAFTLSDTIRKLGSVFGIAEGNFTRFQESLVRGLGKIGLSSEAAGNALTGLAETPVRGEKNLEEYAKAAGQLASVSSQQGREGEIAKGIAGVVTARGGNPNDLKQMSSVSQDVLRIRDATGKSATEALSALNEMFSSANKDFQGRLQKGGAVSLASASLVGGKDATSFLEKYIGMGRLDPHRLAIEAQGFKGIIGATGDLNRQRIFGIEREAKGRGMGDVQSGLRTFGLSDEEAKGFMRLADAMRRSGDAIEAARTKQEDLNKAYDAGKGFAESFTGALNKTKGLFAAPLARATNFGTQAMKDAQRSELGAAGVTLGAGALAAVLAGGGLRGVGGILKGKIAEKAGVQPVYVTNAKEISSGGALSGLGGKAGQVVQGLGLIGAGVATGAALGDVAGGIIERNTQGTNSEGFKGDALDRLMYKLDALLGGKLTGISTAVRNAPQKVLVEYNKRDLKASVQPTRGASIGPD